MENKKLYRELIAENVVFMIKKYTFKDGDPPPLSIIYYDHIPIVHDCALPITEDFGSNEHRVKPFFSGKYNKKFFVCGDLDDNSLVDIINSQSTTIEFYKEELRKLKRQLER